MRGSPKDQFDEWEKRVTFTDLRRKARGPRQVNAGIEAEISRRLEREAELKAQKADDVLQREIDIVADQLAYEAEREQMGSGGSDRE